MPTEPTPLVADVLDPPRLVARRPTLAFMLTHPLHIVSLGFGSGLAPVGAGTAGTLFAWIAFHLLSGWLGIAGWIALIAGGALGGVFCTGFTARRLGVADPSAVVWDEIVAFWLVLLMITPAGFGAQCGAFLLFRAFVIVKPPPIRHIERRFGGGFGIMLDDLVAAFLTLLVIALLRAA